MRGGRRGPPSCLAREALLSLIQHLQYLHQKRAFDTQNSVMVPGAPYTTNALPCVRAEPVGTPPSRSPAQSWKIRSSVKVDSPGNLCQKSTRGDFWRVSRNRFLRRDTLPLPRQSRTQSRWA